MRRIVRQPFLPVEKMHFSIVGMYGRKAIYLSFPRLPARSTDNVGPRLWPLAAAHCHYRESFSTAIVRGPTHHIADKACHLDLAVGQQLVAKGR